MKKILSLLLLLIITSSSCEKDDICDASTSTTPRIVIEFYDFSNPSVLKNVTNLSIIGEGMTEALVKKSNANTISIPLKTTENSTSYRFVLNEETAFDNEDVIKFDYTHENLYVSRACGFKTVFALNATNPLTLSDVAIADGLWIKQIVLNSAVIENEKKTHVKIYF